MPSDRPARFDVDHGHGRADDRLRPRDGELSAPADDRGADPACGCSCGNGAGEPDAGSAVRADTLGSRYRIAQMDCPTEEALIRKRLSGMVEVQALDFNLVQRELTVVHSAGAQPRIEAAIRELGMTLEPLTDIGSAASESPPRQSATALWTLSLSALSAAAAEVAHWLDAPAFLVAVLAALAIAACGLGTYRKGWIALRHGTLNINALMSIAVTGAMLIGEWPEAAMVMVLFTIAELIEARSLDRARNAIRGLMQLAPERAAVQQPDGRWIEVAAKSVAVGSHVRVKPGERIALDGVVLAGRSAVNEAPITGESLPVDKAEGDRVFAGTINQSGSLDYRTTAVAADTTLARIMHAVEEAQASRAPTQRFVDEFARIYTPAVFALALAVALGPPLLFGAPWYDSIYRALVLLVIACPCALVISTPVTIVSGLAAAARHGILVKGGTYLEQGRKLAWLAFDKTGTITHGRPVETELEMLGSLSKAQVRRLAVSLAARSDHPVSRAVALAGEQAGVARDEVSDFAALPGRGVQGTIAGVLYRLGNHRLIEELGVCSPELEARLTALERQGKTTLMLTDGQIVLALFAVADTVRETSRTAIAELHSLGVKTLMLTGDNTHTAEAIAAAVGIDEAHGNLLPEAKAERIAALARNGGKVGMAGDGINDAPALARADIGFAMGAAGTDIAIETADVALMDDDLRKVARFVRLSRATYRVLVQNIALSLGIKAVFLVLALLGVATMWMAVFADMGTSLLVVLNGLRLLRQ